MAVHGSVWGASWRRLRSDPEPVLLPVLGAGFGWLIAWVVVRVVLEGAGTEPVTATLLATFAFLVLGLGFWVVTVRAALRVTRGAEVLPWRAVAAPALRLTLGLGVALTLGVAVGILPGLVIGFLAQSAVLGVLNDGLGAGAALAASARRVAARPGASLLFAGVAALVLGAGVLLLGVGVWAAAALVALAQVSFHDPGRMSG